MRLGLGTGSTAWHLVDLLAQKVADGLDVICVPTSEETARHAGEKGVKLTDLDTIDHLDLTIDGADEIAPDLSLIKGAGGALLREKIVAGASSRLLVIADSSKRVEALGRFPLSIEVNKFGLGATRLAIHAVMEAYPEAEGVSLRRGKDDQPFVTDGGHLILDASFGRISQPEALSRALLDIPGVVQHGLFIGLCDRAYIATPDGVVKMDADTRREG
ncbi:ribose-5-phosphate isomerase RpiA [Devosia pacifica]|uniref:ribose-5-phosphate isomerase RpiA n=1 Tax=Devosia pacifica TaxID=1335967 RepID=UPI001FCE6D9C